MQFVRYYFLSFLSFLIYFIGLKLTIIAVAIGIALPVEKYIDDFGLPIGWVIGLLVGGVFIGGARTSISVFGKA